MAEFYLVLALFLLLNLVGGLYRIVEGPTQWDRLMAAQLFGTTGVAVLLVLAEGGAGSPLRDVALVFAMLAAVNAAVFTARTGSRP